MNCNICGKPTTNKTGICDSCNRIIEKVAREVGSEVWEKIEDCRYIYPMIKRVAEGTLRTQDVVNELLKGESD